LKKKDKVSLVQAHIAMTTFANVREERELDLNEASEDEDDIVLNEWGTSENNDLELFCLCRQPEDERFMVCCDRCDDWFHGECLNMSEEVMELYNNNPDLDFICPFCIAT